GSTRCEIQGTKVWPAEGQVAHHLGHRDDADDVTGGRDDPDAPGTHAPHPPRRIDFEAVGDTGSRRGHLAEHPVVKQRHFLRLTGEKATIILRITTACMV